MKAIILNRFGGREVLEEADLPRSQPKDSEILVRVIAAGVNPVDWKIRQGLLQGRMPHQFPIIPGWDLAGIVEEVAPDISSFKKGDEVFGYARKEVIHDGCYAEWIAVEPRHLAPKPSNLSIEEAAAVPLAGLTAYQSLFESLKIQSGETVLIHAGAGGVGGFAIQLAKGVGAHVITTAGQANHEHVRQLGAKEVIDYTRENFVQVLRKKYPDGIDAVFDTVGGEVQAKSADVLKKGGRLTSILAIDEDFFRKKGIVPGYVFVRPEPNYLRALARLIEEEKIKVHLAAVLPLGQAARAHEMIETGHVRGKIVLLVKEPSL